MSGTELGRVMAEVTAQPPVDVDFGAVEHLVRRRRRNTVIGLTAAAAALLAIVVPVALTNGSTTAGPEVRSTTTPSLAPAIDETSWKTAIWGDLSWRMPTAWFSTDEHLNPLRGPGGIPAIGPVVSNRSLTPCAGLTCSGYATVITTIPTDGVVAEITEQQGLGQPEQLAPADPGTVAAPDSTCAGWNGAATFTSLRYFGTQPYTHAVSFTACLGADQVGSAPALLRQLVASETDAAAVTVDASWRHVTTGRLSLTIPPDWSFEGQRPRSTSNIAQLDSWCVVPTDAAVSTPCPLPTGLHVGPRGAYVWIRQVTSPSRANAAYEDGNSKQAYADCAAGGGKYPTSDQQHLGPQAGGEVVILSACLGSDVPTSLSTQINLVAASIKDSTYPDPKQLCATVPGTVEAAALETVGDIRTLTFGKSHPATGVFPTAAATDFAAWCWVRDDAAERFHVWAAHQGSSPVKTVDVGFPIFDWTRPAPSTAPASAFASSGFSIGPSPTPAVATPSVAPPTPTLTPSAAGGLATRTTAKALCASALGTYSTASLTTVGELRSVRWGPDVQPLPKVFPGAAASDAAAWCWKASGGTAQIYVVHAGDAAVFVIGDAIGSGPVPSGVPAIP